MPQDPKQDTETAARIEALHRELSGYTRRGLEDRAAAVLAELRRLGVGREVTAIDPADEKAVPETPAKRPKRKSQKRG